MSSNAEFFAGNQRPDVVVTGSFSPTRENISLMHRIWRAAFADESSKVVVLPKDMKIQGLASERTEEGRRALWSYPYGYSTMDANRRCRYCKEIVHGDDCKTCGAPQ